jgi:tripartite-type tricarboxylate transporter receptor subunit TctC
MAIDLLPNALPMMQGGKLRALAVTEGKRAAAIPDAPTIAEALGAKFDVVTWHGFAVRAGTPREIVDLLNKHINAILVLPETRVVFERQGVEPVGGSPAAFARFLDEQAALWKPLIAKNNIRAD